MCCSAVVVFVVVLIVGSSVVVVFLVALFVGSSVVVVVLVLIVGSAVVAVFLVLVGSSVVVVFFVGLSVSNIFTVIKPSALTSATSGDVGGDARARTRRWHTSIGDVGGDDRKQRHRFMVRFGSVTYGGAVWLTFGPNVCGVTVLGGHPSFPPPSPLFFPGGAARPTKLHSPPPTSRRPSPIPIPSPIPTLPIPPSSAHPTRQKITPHRANGGRQNA